MDAIGLGITTLSTIDRFTFSTTIYGVPFMSSSSSDDDSQQRFALGFLFALIALIVSSVLGVVVYQRGIAHAPAQTPALVETNTLIIEDGASVRVDNGMVTFYFASGKAELAAGANEALAEVVNGVAKGKKAIVSGFHDATGSAAVNAELSKKRAMAVRDALVSLGVNESNIELKKPEQMLASGGSNAEARRVEVVLSGN